MQCSWPALVGWRFSCVCALMVSCSRFGLPIHAQPLHLFVSPLGQHARGQHNPQKLTSADLGDVMRRLLTRWRPKAAPVRIQAASACMPKSLSKGQVVANKPSSSVRFMQLHVTATVDVIDYSARLFVSSFLSSSACMHACEHNPSAHPAVLAYATVQQRRAMPIQ